ncbi:hypothetical protein AB0E59_40905 [Lentzea sp. NPDC034063]|uniref:PIN-like domain-containing protein n=1 Tax=unclassified Lentzea TaxID=2643253 RepID=UPI0029B0C189|nr:hypothetical protein [Streptomyces sp. ID05-26A]
MKFFLDENAPITMLGPLRDLFYDHEFRSAENEGTTAMTDIALFELLGSRKFDAIITRDQNQLRDADERAALIHNGLHWIGLGGASIKGIRGIALETAAVMGSMPEIVEHMRELESPSAFHVKGLGAQPGQRYRLSPMLLPDGSTGRARAAAA